MSQKPTYKDLLNKITNLEQEIVRLQKSETALNQGQNSLKLLTEEVQTQNEEINSQNEELRTLNEDLSERNDTINSLFNQFSENELLLKKAQQIANIGNWELDLLSGNHYWSDQMYRNYGYSPKELKLTKENIKSHIYAEDLVNFKLIYKQTIKNNRNIFQWIYRIENKQGITRIHQHIGEIAYNEKNKPIKIFGTCQDITEQRRTREALENKINALTKSDIIVSTIKLSDIVDIDMLQKIQDSFAEFHNIPSIIFDLSGKLITKPSNFHIFCNLTRGKSRGYNHCKWSEKYLKEIAEKGIPTIDNACMKSCLINATLPIKINGTHIANWGICQIADRKIEKSYIEKFAKHLNINSDILFDASTSLPVIKKRKIRSVIKFLDSLTKQISIMGLQNLQQVKLLSDQKKIENELLENEKKYRLIFNKSPIGIIHLNKDGIITASNEANFKNMGVSDVNLIGTNIFEGTDNKRFLSKIKTVLSGKSSSFEGELILKISDIPVYIKANFTPLFVEDVKIVGAIGIIENITQRKKAEEKAYQSTLYRKLRAEIWELAAKKTIVSEYEFVNQLFALVGSRILPSSISLLKFINNSEAKTAQQWYKNKNHTVKKRKSIPKSIWNKFITKRFFQISRNTIDEICSPGMIFYGYKDLLLDIILIDNIKSILFFPYIVNNSLEGIITFEWDEETNREWTQAEVYAGIDMSKILSTNIMRMQAQFTIRESEAKYRALVEKSNDGIIIVKDEIIFANQRFCEITGYEDKETLNKDIEIFIAPEERNKIKDYRKRRYTNKFVPAIYETTLLSKTGKLIPVEFNNNIITYGSQKVIMTIIRDLTLRKQAEEERKRLGIVIEQISEGIIITDTQGIIDYVNPAFEKISGYSSDELKGNKTKILKSGKHDNDFYDKLWNTIKKGDIWEGNIINKRKDGTLYEERTVISSIKNEKSEVIKYVAVKRDVTKQINIEKQLKQSQKLQAIGTLAGGIAHDFNNILMGMQIYTEITMMQFPKDDPIRKSLEKIEIAQRRAKELVEQILTFSRQSEDTNKPILIHSSVIEALKIITSAIPSTVKIVLDIEDCGYILGSPTHIHQIIMNLCTNASHAMKGSGVLTIELKLTTKEKIKNTNVAVNSLKTKKWIQLKIADTGEGMTKDTLERIFEPFFTTKEVGKGTGLGMATVHGIINQLNGSINIVSEVNKGSAFYIYLPQITIK